MAINLDEMTIKDKIKLLKKIITVIKRCVKVMVDDEEEEALEYFLGEGNVYGLMESLTDYLDMLDDNDFFGTEGWEHLFGVSS